MNWDDIEGFDGWSAALEQLIIALTQSFATRNEAKKTAALQDLRDFIKFSPNDVAGPLDDIALRTVLGAIAKNWDEGVEELAARSTELAKLTKQIKSITEANVATAENIRMTRIRAVIDGSTGVLKAYSDLKAQLEVEGGPDADVVLAKVDTAVKAIQNLRNSVERI